jgi:hypothetical protein
MSAGRQRSQPAAERRAVRIQSLHSHSRSSTAPDRANEGELHMEHRTCIMDITTMAHRSPPCVACNACTQVARGAATLFLTSPTDTVQY